MSDNRRVKPSRSSRGTLSVGILLFASILLYLGFVTFQYFSMTRIAGYQVREGSLSSNNIFTGIALRDEEIFPADTPGTLNRYAREGEKVATGNVVYAVDSSGRLQEYVSQGDYGENKLKNEDLSTIQENIKTYSSSFSPDSFDSIYDFRDEMDSEVQKLTTASLMEGIRDLNASGSEMVSFAYATKPGIVVYSTDGYETLMPSQVTPESFDRENYQKQQFANGDMITKGDPIYKECVSEDWNVVIQTDQEKAELLEEKGYVRVRFLKNQHEITGKVGVFKQEPDNYFVSLAFNNSMIIFCRDRFLEVELILDETRGLKVPKSALVEKEFYLIPGDYVMEDPNNGGMQVLRRSYMEDGTVSQETVNVTVNQFDQENGEYYVDTSSLLKGDILLKPDSDQMFTVSKTGSLIGVYNINRGFADFKRVEILNENEEYAIVRSGTAYGLSEYDFIVLESDSVGENEFIFE